MMKIVSDAQKEINVKDIDYDFARYHTIAYCTVSGRVCKLFMREKAWRFENIMNANTVSATYECSWYRTPQEAISAVLTKNSTRELQAFENDVEFTTWALEKLRIHTGK